MEFETFAVELPDRGVVGVTGPNGEGKSALIDSVPSGIWNKTLRETPWWNRGIESCVDVHADEWEVHRVRTKGDKNRLDLVGRETFDTATKAQAVFEAEILAFDTWRKTSVFSSAMVEGKPLGLMSDGDTKRLIETVLGLDRFDPAAKAARKQARTNLDTLRESEHARDKSHLQYEAEERRAQEAADQRKGLSAPEDSLDKGAGADLAATVKTLAGELAALRSEARKSTGKDAELRANIRQLVAQAEKLAADACPTCGQAIPDVLRDELEEVLGAARTKADKIKVQAVEELAILDGQIEELEEQLASLRKKHANVDARAGALDRYKAQRTQLETTIRDATLASTRHLSERAGHSRSMVNAAKETATLEAVDRVLGLKGVRAHIMGSMLTGIEQISNSWLERMPWRGRVMRIGIKPYREKAKGGLTDEIDLQIEGAGGGFGYKALSNGQRRRVDVSLLIALAKISHAAHGQADGSLFFDEVFDVLDDVGIAAVAEAMIELGNDRCVVVVSHNAALMNLLQPTLHLHIEDGRILEV